MIAPRPYSGMDEKSSPMRHVGSILFILTTLSQLNEE